MKRRVTRTIVIEGEPEWVGIILEKTTKLQGPGDKINALRGFVTETHRADEMVDPDADEHARAYRAYTFDMVGGLTQAAKQEFEQAPQEETRWQKLRKYFASSQPD